MDSRQAKEILVLYREGIDRADDAEVAEALALAKRDPVLGKWFEEQRAINTKIRAGFQSIAVPEGLKEQIISERRVRTGLGLKRKLVLVAGGVAALILLAPLVLTSVREPGENKQFDGFRIRMTSLVLRAYPKMDLDTSDLSEIHSYLARQGRGDYVLPPTLGKAAGTGCKLLTWQSQPVSMICFNSGKGGKTKNPDLFLFVMDQKAVPDPANANGDIVQVSKLSTIAWQQNGKVYLLGALGSSAKGVQESVASEVRKL